MGSIPVRQSNKVLAIQVDSAEVNLVGILTRDHSTRLEPDLTFFKVNLIHFANDPIALGDGVFYFPGRFVIEIQMIPSAPF